MWGVEYWKDALYIVDYRVIIYSRLKYDGFAWKAVGPELLSYTYSMYGKNGSHDEFKRGEFYSYNASSGYWYNLV